MENNKTVAWSNYRICYRPSAIVPSMQIHEFFYNEKGRIIFYSNDPVVPFGDDLGELMEHVKEMMISFEKEVIDLDVIDRRMIKQEN